MATENTIPNVIDINLSVTGRKPFRIDGDDNRIVYLDTADMTILNRLKEAKPKLQQLQESTAELSTDTGDDIFDTAGTMAEQLSAIDARMRELIDYIFDAPVSKVAAPTGTMYDVFEGQFRYEHIILAFLTQYENSLSAEYEKMQANIAKHTDKYVK